MRTKFIIKVNGKVIKPPNNAMFVMNDQGVFFVVFMKRYYPSVVLLSEHLGIGYDVEFT